MESEIREKVDKFYIYIEGVSTGSIPAASLVQQAVLRHKRDISRIGDPDFPYIFSEENVYRILKFANLMTHWQGKFAGKPFEPEPWQCFIFGSIFGWIHKDTGFRRFDTAYVEVPRKNGKTFMSATIAAYGMMGDGENGAEIYSVANKREQAARVWTDVEKCVSKSRILNKYIRTAWLGSVKTLVCDKFDSTFKPLASDYSKNDSLNPHFVIFDELHELKDRRLFDVIVEAFGARDQALLFIITTAGFNVDGVCYEQNRKIADILDPNGDYEDDTMFGFVSTIDLDDEDGYEKVWDKEEEWFKANPNLGVSKSLEKLRVRCNSAKNMVSEKNAFLNKQLDIWTRAKMAWLKMHEWDKCPSDLDVEKLKRQKCYIGLDLSSTVDLSAIVCIFPPNEFYDVPVVLPFFFMPEDNVEDRQAQDSSAYRKWIEQGFITTTEGNIIDLEFIFQKVLYLKDEYNVVEVGFDPWKAIEIATKLDSEGIKVVQMRQGHSTLGPPSTKFETLVVSNKINHGGNPVLRWMASNTAVIKDANDNIRPDKSQTSARIDGIVALIMGIGRMIVNGDGDDSSRYDTDGIRTV